MIGNVVSHSKIVEKLGEGGMGAVFKAEDTKLNRPVALKCLPPQLASDEDAKKRLAQEAQASSALNHPNIATIYYMFEEGGLEFICMEYVEGQTLSDVLGSDSLPIERVLDIAIQTADGLSEAHKKGIVHRDIKSDNIMVTPRGLVKIMDFGLAKLKGVSRLTRTGSTVGTISYMSPEQAQGLEVDYRTDVFSLGVVLYEMIAGHRPFRGEHEAAILYSLLNEDPEPVEVIPQVLASAMATILQKSLEKDKAYRYQTMEEMLGDLKAAKRLLEGTPTPTTPGHDITPGGGEMGTGILDPEELIGQTVGNYQIIEEIGRGGMGVVYKALQTSLNRIVAMKVLPKQYTRDQEFLGRFRREARAAAGLNHANIIQIYEIGQQSGIHYFIMEYIEGKNLKHLIEEKGALPIQQVLDIAWDTCKALDFAHKHGVIHRDIKPHNIMISKLKVTKVFDFGIARAADSGGLTTTGTSIGTPQYMSPEQARGEKETDGRADLYSLGIVLYEMLVGKVPFEGSTAVGTMYRHVNEIPMAPSQKNPSIPEELDRIVLKALQKEKEKRYQTGEEMIEDLRLAKEKLSGDRGTPSKKKPHRRKRARRIVVLMAIMLVLVLGAAAIYYFELMTPFALVLKTEPPGASVTEAGVFLGTTPLKMTKEQIVLGEHTFHISMSDYAEEVHRFSLKESDKIDLILPLSKSFGGLSVESDPSGAQVVLDDVSRGTTPVQIEQLKIGAHTLTLHLPGYTPWEGRVNISQGAVDTSRSRLSPLPSTFIVSTVPESASLWIDSLEYEDQTPLTLSLEPGEHLINIMKEGFVPLETLLTFRPGQEHPEQFILSSLEDAVVFGSLKIHATPWAEVFVDGKSLGTTKEKGTFEKITAGSHKLRLTHPNYFPHERRVHVGDNEVASVSHDFTAKGSLNITCIDEYRNQVFGEIWIDGKTHGTPPKVIRDLFVGQHQVQIIKDGYTTETKYITIKANEREKIQFIMKVSP
ncbi:MAG: serine/threonine protein kinase [Gemmatimonadota bacterium]|nr:MAG: serine/threonine protein kinase [Gemmatimonadota bacterium]